MSEKATIEQLRELTDLQARDEALWAPGLHIETAYVQQALRYLTRVIEGGWSIDEGREAMKEMQP